MRRIWLTVALITGCGAPDPASEPAPESPREPLGVYTVNYPLQYFAERIGGDHVRVSLPAPPGVDPAYWNPDAEAVTAYQNADLILLNGASYAKWVDRVTLPVSKLVDTSQSFRDRYIIMEDAVVHSHGPEGEHSHRETAFTTWLDPNLAVEQASAILDALIAAQPEHETSFQEGFAALRRDLLALDERIERAVSASPDTPLVASHPVYHYLARRYGLNLASVHFEPDAHPDPDGWHELEHVLGEHPARWMIWERAPIAQTAERLRMMGLEIAVADPCALAPATGDYLSVMAENASALETVFSSPQ